MADRRATCWDWIYSQIWAHANMNVFASKLTGPPCYLMARTTLTDDILKEIIRLKSETGLGPMKLLARACAAPEGLDSAIINTWLNGKTRSARADHLAFVLNAYRQAAPVLAVTDEMREKLTSEMARTGCTPARLLNRIAPYPDGLTALEISRWATGRLKTAESGLWAFVMDGLAALPDKPA